MDTVTTLFLSLAVGFFAASLASPVDARRADSAPAAEERDNPTPDGHSDRLRLNDMMETSK